MLLFLLLALVSPKAIAIKYWDHQRCTNVLQFVAALAVSSNRFKLVQNWRMIVTYQYKENAINKAQFNARRLEVQDAIKIVIELEHKGYKEEEVVRIASVKCST